MKSIKNYQFFSVSLYSSLSLINQIFLCSTSSPCTWCLDPPSSRCRWFLNCLWPLPHTDHWSITTDIYLRQIWALNLLMLRWRSMRIFLVHRQYIFFYRHWEAVWMIRFEVWTRFSSNGNEILLQNCVGKLQDTYRC